MPTFEAFPYDSNGERDDAEPLYQVVLFNDEDHTYEYVIEMLGDLFGLSIHKAHEIAYEVDFIGEAVVYVAPFEEAALARDRIHAYGPDSRLDNSHGSMKAAIMPLPEEVT